MDDPVDQVLGQRIVVALVDSDEAALVVLDNVLVEEAVLGLTVAARSAAS
ncbi:MAG: hypothetical protein IPP45_19330 [Sphingomonadales bacterium]|nr:hypothetical protein [Sphingomonadales bacterium]